MSCSAEASKRQTCEIIKRLLPLPLEGIHFFVISLSGTRPTNLGRRAAGRGQRGLENMVSSLWFHTVLRFGRKRMRLERRKYGNPSDRFSGVMMAFFPCFRLPYL